MLVEKNCSLFRVHGANAQPLFPIVSSPIPLRPPPPPPWPPTQSIPSQRPMNFLRSAREYMTPVLQASQYLEKGVLTPEEFVAAGDLLVMKCPTWAWASGDAKKVKAYLPADKQYLVTKGAPCMQRVSALESAYVGEEREERQWRHEGA